MLVSHGIGRDLLVRHRPHSAAVRLELARPAVRARAALQAAVGVDAHPFARRGPSSGRPTSGLSLHPEHAGRQRRNHRAQLGARNLGLAQHHRSPLIDAVRGKDVLHQNDAGRNNAQRPPLRTC